jgi:hypothetical protein
MRKFVVAAALLAAGCLTADAAEVGGKYEVRGKNPNGSRYSGTAVIIPTANYTCRIEWSVGSESSGICMLKGSAFAAGYTLGNKVGLVIYNLRDDGTLDGTWTVADEDGFGTEILIPMN